MGSVAVAVIFALFVWWFSTGVLLLVVRAGRRWRAPAMAVMTVLAALSLAGLIATRTITEPASALAGFTYGVVIWGFLEATFLFGYVTGPRRVAARPGVRGLPRFLEALAALAYHELAILLVGIVLVALTIKATNAVGTATFLVLWAMRISAKLNLFLGAPNVSVDVLPRHLAYLGSYFARRPIGFFFCASVTSASVALGYVLHAQAHATSEFQAVSLALIATILALAILEHWFMVLPFADTALWRWALREEPADRPSGNVPLSLARAPAARHTHFSVRSPVRRVRAEHRDRGDNNHEL